MAFLKVVDSNNLPRQQKFFQTEQNRKRFCFSPLVNRWTNLFAPFKPQGDFGLGRMLSSLFIKSGAIELDICLEKSWYLRALERNR